MNKEDYVEITHNDDRWLSLEDLPNEEWKDIQNYEELYQVSNYGRVKSLLKTLSDGRLWQPRILREENNHGYKRVTLAKNGVNKTYRVHKLVAQCFLQNINNYPLINHKDENKSNNKLYNLEYCTSAYNSNYGNCKYKIAEKLSKPVNQYDINFNLLHTYKSLSDAGRQTGLSIAYISQCCNGYYKYAYGYIWKYVEGGDVGSEKVID